MIRATFFLGLLAQSAWATEVVVPSGQPVTLQEVLIDEIGTETWMRFRFVAPAISKNGGTVTYDVAFEDMTHLCQELSLPYLAEYQLHGDIIVISLADSEVEFGQANPDVTQFFEAFRPVDKNCIWEAL
ncbi:MAG: DUF6497 family protein [Sulfitobacter sp.]|nr:DUF6497 family protein [Sulfitobacter sp.]